MSEWVPTERFDTLMPAEPPESAAVPSDVAPSKNSIVPLAATGDTLALKLTDWPERLGFGVVLSVTVVAATFTSCRWTADVLPLKLGPPEYTAVRLCEPTLSVDVLRLADPPATDDVPSEMAPSKNCMEPSGPPAPGELAATVAESVVD